MPILRLTLMLMQRGMYDTVTREHRIPVLIPAEPSQQEGFATFFRTLTPPTPVRIFRDSDMKNLRKYLDPEDAQHFVAVFDLTNALQNSDLIALRKAIDRFKKVYDTKRSKATDLHEFIDEEFSNQVLKHTDLSAVEAMDVLRGRRPSSQALRDPRWLLSEEVSTMLSVSSRLVLWWSGKHFTPAIWCDDIKTAFHIRALLNVVGGKGVRICPHCSEVFFQQRPDQNYCSVAHREAHRVARWRAMKLSKSKKKGGKRGTRKAR